MKGSIFFFGVFFITLFVWGNSFAANWTFMVYLDGDNDLEEAAISDFMEMSTVGSDANVNIIVQFDRIGVYDTSYDGWSSCKRFFVSSGMEPVEANAVEDIGECNMGDSDTLMDFIDWGVTNYPADYYAVILWNHGDGWREQQAAVGEALGMAGTNEEAEEIVKMLRQADSLAFKAVCSDETNSGDVLYLEEVESALSAVPEDMDLIGFDACLMGMLEVAYELKDLGANVMVASEEAINFNGWPYDTILADLASDPSYTPVQLGMAMVDRFDESNFDDHTLSAVSLDNMDTLGGTVNDFADTMQNSWDTDTPAVQAAAQLVMDEIASTVIHEQHGDSLPGSHGIAIYFPAVLGDFDSDYNGSVIDFPADTLWDEFLSSYYASMGGSWLAGVRSSSQQYYLPEHVDLFDFCEKIVTGAGCDIAEGFEAGIMPPDEWELISTHTGDETWFVDNATASSGSNGASCNYDPDLIDQDEILISPECRDPQNLSFWSLGSLYWGGGQPYDNYDLEIWLVKDDWDAGSVDDIYLGNADDDWSDTFVWSESSFDLSSYDGAYRIAFRYIGNDGAQATLDDICLECLDQTAPVADAGPDQTVNEGVTVTLDGSGSSDPDDDIASYLWEQIDGPSAPLTNATSAQATFTAPDVDEGGASLTFRLRVTDAANLIGTDTCVVTVTWVEGSTPTLSGDTGDGADGETDRGDGDSGGGGCFISSMFGTMK